MKLTLKRRLTICIEVLFARSGHAHTAQEKGLPLFIRGYEAGRKDESRGWSGTKAKNYNTLLMAVQHKIDGETRFETALRHINHNESPTTKACAN